MSRRREPEAELSPEEEAAQRRARIDRLREGQADVAARTAAFNRTFGARSLLTLPRTGGSNF